MADRAIEIGGLRIKVYDIGDGTYALSFAERGAPNFATGQGTATTDAGTIVAARATRRALLVVNASAVDMYLGAGTAVTATTGLLLTGTEGAAVSMKVTGAVHGITAAGSAVYSYAETYD